MASSEQLSASGPVAGPASAHLRKDIQGLRGLAVLLVVLFHAGVALPGGYVGVDVFFVISGFVITQMLWRELGTTKRLSLREFYARRIRRILPALALLVSGVAVLSALLENPLVGQRNTARAGAAASSFLANQYFAAAKTGYFDVAVNANPLLHTWSLSVEEQFYLVFPLTLLLATVAARKVASKVSSKRAAVAIVGAGFLVSFVLSLLTTRGDLHGIIHSPAKFAYYSAATRAWEFAAGALVALAATKFTRVRANDAMVFGIAGLLLVLYGARTFTRATQFPGTAAVLPVAGTALMIIAGLRAKGGVTRLLSTKPMVWIGDVSYGWYLWHWPFIVFVTALWSRSTTATSLAALAALVPTYLSYRYVEQPIRHNASIRGRRAVRVAAICIGIPIVLCLALGASARAVSHTSTLRDLADAARLHVDERRGCEGNGPITARPARCVWPATGSQGAIWLVGDSNAGHFTEPVIAAANRNHYDLHVATSAGCAFADVILLKNHSPLTGCRRFVTGALASLAAQKPALVVVASDATDYIASSQFQFRDPVTLKVARRPAAKAAEWQTALHSMLRRLTAAGVPVLVVDTVPHFGDWDLASCPAIRVYVSAKSCGTSSSRAAITRQQAPGLDATHAAMAGLPNVTDIDFTADLCSATRCPTNHGTQFLYRDFSHLTIATALTLTPGFTAAIRRAVPAVTGL